jgi:hypothetical protein
MESWRESIDTLKRELSAILFALSAVGILFAQYCGDADANRLGCEDWTEAQQTSDQENGPESHRPSRVGLRPGFDSDSGRLQWSYSF